MKICLTKLVVITVSLATLSCKSTKFSSDGSQGNKNGGQSNGGQNNPFPNNNQILHPSNPIYPGGATGPVNGFATPSPDPNVTIGTGDGVLFPVDTGCALGTLSTTSMVIAPMTPNLPRTVPNNCRSGIEFNNYYTGTFTINAMMPISLITPLEVDVATYSAPDSITINAINGGMTTPVLRTCRLRTWDRADPTLVSGSNSRPDEVTIRSFRTAIPPGTTSLQFDFHTVSTPTYIRVIGLCNFNITPINATGHQIGAGLGVNPRPVMN